MVGEKGPVSVGGNGRDRSQLTTTHGVAAYYLTGPKPSKDKLTSVLVLQAPGSSLTECVMAAWHGAVVQQDGGNTMWGS